MRYEIEFYLLNDGELKPSRKGLTGYWGGQRRLLVVDDGTNQWPRVMPCMELPAAQAIWDAFSAMTDVQMLSARPE